MSDTEHVNVDVQTTSAEDSHACDEHLDRNNPDIGSILLHGNIEEDTQQVHSHCSPPSIPCLRNSHTKPKRPTIHQPIAIILCLNIRSLDDAVIVQAKAAALHHAPAWHHARKSTAVFTNLAIIMERTDEQILPAVYRFLGASFNASPSQLGVLTLSRALTQALTSPVGGLLGVLTLQHSSSNKAFHPPSALSCSHSDR